MAEVSGCIDDKGSKHPILGVAHVKDCLSNFVGGGTGGIIFIWCYIW